MATQSNAQKLDLPSWDKAFNYALSRPSNLRFLKPGELVFRTTLISPLGWPVELFVTVSSKTATNQFKHTQRAFFSNLYYQLRRWKNSMRLPNKGDIQTIMDTVNNAVQESQRQWLQIRIESVVRSAQLYLSTRRNLSPASVINRTV